jgi:hypothetical protein
VKDTVGLTGKEAKGKASEVQGKAKGKFEEIKGKAQS